MPPNPADVDKILQTILVPSFPPNRSQWRKLDLALKFINKSKHSSTQTRKRSNAQEYNSKQSVICEYQDKTEKSNPDTDERFKIRMDSNTTDGGNDLEEDLCLKKRSIWSKIKSSSKHIL
jgi:hypothetical protein